MEAKKSIKADLERWRGTFLNVGLIGSIGLVILAFDYRQAVEEPELLASRGTVEELFDIPNTVIEPPEPPKPKILDPIIEPTPEEEVETNLNIEFTSNLPEVNLEDYILGIPEEEVPEEPFTALEDGANFPGGINALMQFLGQNIKYPAQARRMGITGRVIVKFVVEPDGSISSAQVLRGIGAGCDEEALTAINNMPRWNPGKQRGRPVRQWMVVPVLFSLN